MRPWHFASSIFGSEGITAIRVSDYFGFQISIYLLRQSCFPFRFGLSPAVANARASSRLRRSLINASPLLIHLSGVIIRPCLMAIFDSLKCTLHAHILSEKSIFLSDINLLWSILCIWLIRNHQCITHFAWNERSCSLASRRALRRLYWLIIQARVAHLANRNEAFQKPCWGSSNYNTRKAASHASHEPACKAFQ